MQKFIVKYIKIYVQLAEISLPIYITYTHIKILIVLQFLINLNLFYPPSRYDDHNDYLKYFYEFLNVFLYPNLIRKLDSYFISTTVLIIHFAFIFAIYYLQFFQVLYKLKQPILPQLQQYILQLFPICFFQPIVLHAMIVLLTTPLDIFSTILAIVTLIFLFALIIMSTLFFVSPTQWLLRSRPFAQPYGSYFCPIVIYQYITLLLHPLDIPKFFDCILLFIYFLLSTLSMTFQKFRTTYSDLQYCLSATSLVLSLIYLIRIMIYSDRELTNNLITEFYEFWILGLLAFAVSSCLRRLLHSNCCTYQQIGQMLDFDKGQLSSEELHEYKFSFILTKIYHDKELVTPYCPFKRKDVQESWFYNDKSSLSHFLHSIFTLNENLKSFSSL